MKLTLVTFHINDCQVTTATRPAATITQSSVTKYLLQHQVRPLRSGPHLGACTSSEASIRCLMLAAVESDTAPQAGGLTILVGMSLCM